VPVDGGTSVALTPDGSNPIPGAEHGFTDAQWASTTALLLQGEGLAGPRIFERRPDGTVRPFDVPGLPDDGRLVRSGEGRIVVSYAPDRGVLPLYSVRLDGDPMAIFPAPGPGDVLDIATNDWGTATAFGDRTAALDPLPPFENTEGLGHGGNKAQVCPASFYDRLPSALDADRNGAVETLQLSAVSGAGGFIDTRVELVERGSFPPRVLAGATVEVRAHGQEAYWYGDLNGDGWSEAVSCIPAWSGSGHPLTGLVVFGSGPSGWRVALSGVGNGAPVWIEARRDGLVVTLEAAYMAGTCRETTRDIYGWRDGLLVPTSHEMVSRRVVFPEDVEPVLGQCPWDRPQG